MEKGEETVVSKGTGGEYDRLATTEAGLDWVVQDAERFMEYRENEHDNAAAVDEEEVLPAEEDSSRIHTTDGLIRDGASINSSTHNRGGQSTFWNKCLFPDHRLAVLGVDLVDGPAAVKLLKFLAVTLGGICVFYKFIRFMNWENKKSFTLERFWTYESTQVVTDTVAFFLVARLWKQRGVDHLAWLATLVASNVFMSCLPNFTFLQASFSLYDIHCKWSWKLWVFVALLIPLILTDVFLHVRYAVRHGFFARKFVELVLAVIFWFLPYASSPYFHFHHWFAGWWVGMHANFDTWWSRATLAWCWGLYVNGIAAYGRDPVLTCGYALFLSEQNRCPFLDCYLDGINHPPDPEVTNHTHTAVQPMVKPDWRNCSADAYHP